METETGYTPGPWHSDHGQIRDDRGNALARVPHLMGDEHDHANARLIAAAPELADAARALLDRLDNMTVDEFQRGGERNERERLRAGLAAVRAVEG